MITGWPLCSGYLSVDSHHSGCSRGWLGRQWSCRAHSWTRQSAETQTIFAPSTAFILLILAHDLKKSRGKEWRGGGRWDKQVTLSPMRPFLYTAARTQIFTGKSQLSIHTWSEFQKWLPLTTAGLRASTTAHKLSITSTVLWGTWQKKREENATQWKTRVSGGFKKTKVLCISVSVLPMMQNPGTTYVHTIKKLAWKSWGQWQSNGEGWPFFQHGKKTKHWTRL